jgi:hypothetical protein
MKSKILFLTLLLGLASMVYAQDEATTKPKKFWYGIKFGLDATTSTNSVTSLQDQLKGNYQFGGFLQFGRKLYFQPEIYYASYSTETEGTDESTTEPITFVKAPILLGLQLLDIGLVSVHINGGTTYIKQLKVDNAQSTFKWTVGAGANVLGFITADVRYIFQGNVDPNEIQDLITNGGMVNLTVGLRL